MGEMVEFFFIGYAGEINARRKPIDISDLIARWPEATPTLMVNRPKEDAPYPAETTIEGSVLYWEVSDIDVAKSGFGQAQVYMRAEDGALLGKSEVINTLIKNSLNGAEQENPPPAVETWVTKMLDASEEMKKGYILKNQGTEHAGKVLGIGPDGILTPMEYEAGTGGVSIDTTLTQSGQAADAAAVGEKLNELNEAIGDFATVRIAANDSTDVDKALADVVCDGVNDEVEINAAMESFAERSGTIIMAAGNYYIGALLERTYGGVTVKYGILMDHPTNHRQITIKANNYTTRASQDNTDFSLSDGMTAIIHLTDDCYDAIASGDTVNVIGGYPQMVFPNMCLEVNNIAIKLQGNDKPIIGIDGKYLSILKSEGVVMSCEQSSTVNPKNIGIRSSQGWCEGIQNEIKNCKINGFGCGFLLAGEHLVATEIMAHRCMYGFVFGDVSSVGTFDRTGMHNITLINCSVEKCDRSLTFGSSSGVTNVITLIDFNTEVYDNSEWIAKELYPGAFCGSISYYNISATSWDISTKPFWQDASTMGKTFRCINQAAKFAGTTAERPVNPDYLFEYFDTDINKKVIWNGVEWVGDVTVNTTSISIDQTTLNFTSYESRTLTATVEPANSTQGVTWESSNNDVAMVSGGLVTPVGNGECVITATSGAYSATCAVDVNIAESSDEDTRVEVADYNTIQGFITANNFETSTNGATTIYFPVSPYEKYQISRALADDTNRFRYCFSANEPTVNMSTSPMQTHDGELVMNDIFVPGGYNYMLVYVGGSTYPTIPSGFSITKISIGELSGTVLLSDITLFERGTGGFYGGEKNYQINFNANRLSAPLKGLRFEVGDTIDIVDYTTYNFALGTNDAGTSVNNRVWIDTGTFTTQYTLVEEDLLDAWVIMIRRNDNENFTQTDIDYINANAKVICAT